MVHQGVHQRQPSRRGKAFGAASAGEGECKPVLKTITSKLAKTGKKDHLAFLVFGYLATDLQANGYEAINTAEILLDEVAEEVGEEINSLAARVRDRPAVSEGADLALPSSSLPLLTAARARGPRSVEPEQASGAIAGRPTASPKRPLSSGGGEAAEGKTWATTSQHRSEKAPRPGPGQG